MTVNTWNQAAGTFSGSGFSNLTVNILTVSGGTFTSPTTVSTTGINPTFTVPNNQSFTNLSVSVAAGAWINGSANTLVVTNTLTINGGMNNGVISAQGNITQTSSSSSGTTIIDFAAVGAQTYTVNGGGGPVVRLDSSDDASDSITFAAAGSLNGITTTSGFSGTIPISNASNFSITVTTWSQAAGTFNGGAYTLTTTILTVTGGTFNAPTTVSTTGINPTITVPNNQSFTNLTLGVAAGVWINGGANTLVTTGTLAVNTTLSGGTISAQGNITQSSNAGGGTTTIDFSAAGAQTYTMNGGTAPVIRLDEAADASDTISFAAAATIGTLNVTSGFSGTIPITNASNFTMTVNNWTQAAGTFNGGSFSNLNINALTISGGTFNAPTTVTMVGSSPVYNVNVTQTFTNLTVNAPSGVTSVSAGDTLIASGTLTFTSGFNNSGSTGVFEADGNCTVGSSWGGGTGPLKFGGSATQSFNLTGATGVYDGDITINKTGGQVNMASDLVLNAANQDLKIQSGVFNLNGKNLTVNGSTGTTVFQNGGTFQWQGGETLTLNAGNPTIQTGSTVTFTGNGNAGANTYTVTTLATTYYNLSIVSTDGTTDTYQLGANIDINGKFTNSGAFDVSTSNRQMNVAGDWTNTGSFNARAGTVIMDGTSQHVDDTTFFNFTHIASDDTLTFLAGETQTFTGTLDLEGTSGHPLLLRSSVTGTYASIDPQGARIIGYVDVEDSNNVNATAVSCAVTCIDSGHNVNWTLPAPPPPPGRYDYTGAKVILSRLQDPTPTTVDINYTAVNTLAAGSIITITFPAGWTSFVAPTGGSGLGTSPTFGTFANGYTVTCGTGGCASGAITITGGQATTPASPGTYIISITNNANTDVAQVAVAVVDSDQVTLSATVNATLTFDIDTPASGATCTSTGSPYNVPFGTVTTGDVRTSGTTDGVPRICLNVATNAAHGVIVTVKSDNGAMKSTAVPSNTIPSSTAAMSAGTANYGICLVTAASGFTATSPFASTCAIDSNTNSVGGLTANTQTLMTSSGPVASGTSTVSANVAISGITPAHDDYADGLTFVATAKF